MYKCLMKAGFFALNWQFGVKFEFIFEEWLNNDNCVIAPNSASKSPSEADLLADISSLRMYLIFVYVG